MFVLFVLFHFNLYSQISEGQDFCSKTENASYFPLSIAKKKILWSTTYYFETIVGKKEINNKEYIEFKQEWENKEVDFLYLREENGVVYQYDECCEKETIRLNSNFKKGDEWTNAEGTIRYKILSLKGKLKTPYCKEYQDLLVIEAAIGSKIYNYYYLQGHGYIGATQNKKLISCVTPQW